MPCVGSYGSQDGWADELTDSIDSPGMTPMTDGIGIGTSQGSSPAQQFSGPGVWSLRGTEGALSFNSLGPGQAQRSGQSANGAWQQQEGKDARKCVLYGYELGSFAMQ